MGGRQRRQDWAEAYVKVSPWPAFQERFVDSLDVGYDRKRCQDDFKDFSLTN